MPDPSGRLSLALNCSYDIWEEVDRFFFSLKEDQVRISIFAKSYTLGTKSKGHREELPQSREPGEDYVAVSGDIWGLSRLGERVHPVSTSQESCPTSCNT